MNRSYIYCAVVLLNLFVFSLEAGATPLLADQATVSWKCSTREATWQEKGALTTLPWKGDKALYVDIDNTKTLQQVAAWGGCFNEKGWDAMLVLSDAERESVMKALFDPNDGLKLNVCRTPIGASDYAISSYSLDDAKDDYSLAKFSIERDKENLIPYIKAAIAIRPDLKFWGVPWSPPGWMKDSNSLIGGHIKTDDKTMDALALYFEKYVQAYRKEGINIFMIMPQNEPTENTSYPSCLWNGVQLHDFIKNHLSPRFTADSVDCDIWLGTFTNSDYSYVSPTVDDPDAFSRIKGASFQWFGDKSCTRLHKEHPELPLMQSETVCGDHQNDWVYAESQFDLIKTYLEAGVSSYMLWNMVLDETGRSTANWNQCSPVVVNKHTRTITYTPQYYVFKHFSYYVQPGAHLLTLAGNYGDKVAFVNPNGDTILVLKNKSSQDLSVSINFAGEEINPTLPAHSFNTFVKKH